MVVVKSYRKSDAFQTSYIVVDYLNNRFYLVAGSERIRYNQPHRAAVMTLSLTGTLAIHYLAFNI